MTINNLSAVLTEHAEPKLTYYENKNDFNAGIFKLC